MVVTSESTKTTFGELDVGDVYSDKVNRYQKVGEQKAKRQSLTARGTVMVPDDKMVWTDPA